MRASWGSDRIIDFSRFNTPCGVGSLSYFSKKRKCLKRWHLVNQAVICYIDTIIVTVQKGLRTRCADRTKT